MFTILKHPFKTARILLLSFPYWYFWTVPKGIVKKYCSYAHAFAEIISFRFLLRTLFSPWKNITDTPSRIGFSISRLFETFIFNMVTRIIGFLFRFTLILIGILIQILCIFLLFAFLAFWYVYPIGFFLGVRYLMNIS